MIFHAVTIYIPLTGDRTLDLNLVVLSTFFAALATLMLYFKGYSLKSFLQLALSSLLYLMIGLEALAFIKWSSYPLWMTRMYSEPTWMPAEVEMKLFYALGSLAPLLMLLVLVSWPVVFINSAGRGKPLFHVSSSLRWRDPKVVALLASASVIAALLTLYPYHPSLNPHGYRVSVDLYFYNQWLSEMLGKPPLEALNYALREVQGGSRPLHLILLYLAAKATSASSELVSRAQLTFLAVFFVLSTYLLARELFRDELNAALAALISSCSFNLTVGMYAGFASHWLALSMLFITLTLYLKADSRNLYLCLAALLSVALHFTYVWAWSGLMAILVAHEAIGAIYRKECSSRPLHKLVLMLAAGLTANAVKSVFLASIGSVEASTKLVQDSFSLVNPYENLVRSVTYYLMGCYINTPLLAFTLMGALLLTPRDEGHRLILSILIPVSVAALLSHYALHAHILFNLPVPFLTVRAFEWLKAKSSCLAKLFLVWLLLVDLNYAIRLMASLTAYF